MSEAFDLMLSWEDATDDKYRSLWVLASRIFQITHDEGTMNIPDKLRTKALNSWFKGNKDLLNDMYSQTVTFIYNLVTHDTNIMNTLRSKRPDNISSQSDRTQVEKLAEETSKDCDLCNYEGYTAEDTFGRLVSEYAYTMSNAFKFDAWHAMVALKTHHPIDWPVEELVGSFQLITQWFDKVYSISPSHTYPIIMFDAMPPGGGSQIHPHLHMSLNKDRYYGEFGRWYHHAEEYHQKYDSCYWDDLIQVSSALGLTANLGDATAIVSLTPKKDHEIVLHCPHANDNLWRLLYYVIQMYFHQLKRYSFSMAMVLPPWGRSTDRNWPAIARIVPRATLYSPRSDISSLELFTSPNINIDPLRTAAELKKVMSQATVAGSPATVASHDSNTSPVAQR